MSGNGIRIVKIETVTYTVVPQHFIRRTDISRAAKMLLIEMMSHAETWEFSVAGLEAQGTEGKHAVNTMVVELEGAGLLHRFRDRDESGQLAGAVWVFGWNRITEEEAKESAFRRPQSNVGFSHVGKSTTKKEQEKEVQTRTNDTREANERTNEPPTLDVWLIEYLSNVEVAIKPGLAANIAQQVLSAMLDRYPDNAATLARQYLAERVVDMGCRDNVPDERSLARWMIKDVREWEPSDKPKVERTVELGGFKEVF